MLRIFIIMIIFVSSMAQAKIKSSKDKLFDYNFNLGLVNINNTDKKDQQPGYFEPSGGAARKSIELGLSPAWTAVLDSRDRERMGYGSFCLGKDCQKKNMDSDLRQLEDKFSNKA